ncbi:hypothetical protein M0802_006987 [Mischocyttarus mexicanus]|nr:hypothetical protein M0802_006987 [Mischocyttarus mexicanus]
MLTKVLKVEYACGWNIYTMKFLGIWPEERRLDQISSYKVLLTIVIILLFCTIPQYWQLYIDRNDFDLVMENICVDNLNATTALIKMMFFWFNGKPMKELLTTMEIDWKEVSTKNDEQKMMELAKFSRILATRATEVCYVLIATCILKTCLSMRTEGPLLFLTGHFPFDLMTNHIFFACMFIGQVIGTIYYTTAYTAVDTFIAMLILHVCGQLSRLQNELINLNSITRLEFQKKLNYIIRRHDHLNRFVDTIEDQFNIMLLFHMLGCTVQLCIECFQGLILMSGKSENVPLADILFFALYVFYMLLQLYLYCYVGEKLWTESTEVARAAYECKWYDLLPHEAKSLILIIRRSRSPLRLTAGKFCIFNHELFSSVLKTSMGYLSVLRTTMINDE